MFVKPNFDFDMGKERGHPLIKNRGVRSSFLTDMQLGKKVEEGRGMVG